MAGVGTATPCGNCGNTALIHLREEAQLAAVLLGYPDEVLAHLGASAGEVTKCGNGLRVQRDALAAELVQRLVTNDQPRELEERGERTKLWKQQPEQSGATEPTEKYTTQAEK